MVAGASGIDLVLLVVDAAQGPQPQTWEHLAIVEQLRIPRGIPVITKADLADPEWIELVAEELGARLAKSPVAFEAVAVVSATTGQGIPGLAAPPRAPGGRQPRGAWGASRWWRARGGGRLPARGGRLGGLVGARRGSHPADDFRMPVDRAFS